MTRSFVLLYFHFADCVKIYYTISKESLIQIELIVKRAVKEQFSKTISDTVEENTSAIINAYIAAIKTTIEKLENVRIKFINGINENKKLSKEIRDTKTREGFVDLNDKNLKRFDCEDLQGILDNISSKPNNNSDGSCDVGLEL